MSYTSSYTGAQIDAGVAKANTSVQTSGNETIAGTKTFSSSVVISSASPQEVFGNSGGGTYKNYLWKDTSNWSGWDTNRNPSSGTFDDANKTTTRIECFAGDSDSGVKIYTSPTNNTVATSRFEVDKDGNIYVPNYIRLGDASPSIKVKKITGTTASTQGGIVSIAHGVTWEKIISVTAVVQNGTNSGILPGYIQLGYPGYYYSLDYGGTNVRVLNHGTDSAGILSKPVIIYITYEA